MKQSAPKDHGIKNSPVRMAVLTGWRTVSGPACVSDTSVGLESFFQVWFALRNEFLQLCNLSNFLVSRNFLSLVAIDGQSRGIIASVFESRKSCSGYTG